MTVHYESDFVPDYAKRELKDFFIKDENYLETIPEHLEVSSSCLLYTSPSPRDMRRSRMPSSA